MSIKNNKPTKNSAYRQGYFKPQYPVKYIGTGDIIFRSSWEHKFMVWCDNNEKVLILLDLRLDISMTKVNYKNKYYKTSKLPPCTMSYKGNKSLPTTDIEIINYSEVDYATFITNEVQDTFNFKDNRHVTWINING